MAGKRVEFCSSTDGRLLYTLSLRTVPVVDDLVYNGCQHWRVRGRMLDCSSVGHPERWLVYVRLVPEELVPEGYARG